MSEEEQVVMEMHRLGMPWAMLTADQRKIFVRLARDERMHQQMRVLVDDHPRGDAIVWARRIEVADLFEVPEDQAEAMDVYVCFLSEAGGIAARNLAEAYRP